MVQPPTSRGLTGLISEVEAICEGFDDDNVEILPGGVPETLEAPNHSSEASVASEAKASVGAGQGVPRTTRRSSDLANLVENSCRKELLQFRTDMVNDIRDVLDRKFIELKVGEPASRSVASIVVPTVAPMQVPTQMADLAPKDAASRLSDQSDLTAPMTLLSPMTTPRKKVSLLTSLSFKGAEMAPRAPGAGNQQRDAVKAAAVAIRKSTVNFKALGNSAFHGLHRSSTGGDADVDAVLPHVHFDEADDEHCPEKMSSAVLASADFDQFKTHSLERWMNAGSARAVRAEMIEDWRRSHCQQDEVVTEMNRLSTVVESLAFDLFSSALIFINACTIGFQTDVMAKDPGRDVPEAYVVIDKVFCFLFTVELIIRISAYRWKFFFMPGWRWSVFDTFLVGMQLSEEMLMLVTSGDEETNVSFIRVLKILRLVRVLRVVRIVRLIEELRTIVISIVNAMQSLFWTLVLLLLMIYVASLYFTQLVLDYRAGKPDASSNIYLIQYYGEVGRSMLSLFQAISGGVDWDILCAPLVEEISVVHAILFCCYIAFAVLALMNVVTGVFVEGALKSAHQDSESRLMQNLRFAFQEVDVDGSGTLSKKEFLTQVHNPKLQDVLKSMNIDVGEANALFYALDMDDIGAIAYEEFVYGCMRLRGGAKAIDMFTLMKNLATLHRDLRNLSEHRSSC